LRVLLASDKKEARKFFQTTLLQAVRDVKGNFRDEVPLAVARAGQRVFGDQEASMVIADCTEAISEFVLNPELQAV